MSATASPQSTAKLTEAVSARAALADAINRIAGENVRLRTEADARDRPAGGAVNDALHAIDDINRKIASLVPKGVDVTGLQDERQRIIDGISSIVPVRTVKRENDQVALYSANGGVLLDGQVFELGFDNGGQRGHARHDASAPGSAALMQDQGAAAGPVTVAAGTGGGLFDGGSLGGALRGARPDRAGVRRRDRPLRQRPDRAVPRPDAGERRSTPRATGCSSTAARAG